MTSVNKSQPAAAAQGGAATRKILVADDEPTVRLSIRMVLKKLGAVAIDEADDGRKALQKLYDGGYDLVLLDMLMPNMNGIEFLETARIIDPAPPVVIVSAYADIPQVKAVRHLAAGVIQKPFDIKELEQVCRKLLGL